MKKSYNSMTVELVGEINSIVNKSGSATDLSQNFESKKPDRGGGQEKKK